MHYQEPVADAKASPTLSNSKLHNKLKEGQYNEY
jgi:hypothetical protein